MQDTLQTVCIVLLTVTAIFTCVELGALKEQRRWRK